MDAQFDEHNTFPEWAIVWVNKVHRKPARNNKPPMGKSILLIVNCAPEYIIWKYGYDGYEESEPMCAELCRTLQGFVLRYCLHFTKTNKGESVHIF